MAKSNQTPSPTSSGGTIKYNGVCDSRVTNADKQPTRGK